MPCTVNDLPQCVDLTHSDPPLGEPDVRITHIRLSDKTSRLRPRHVVPKPAQTYEPEVPVEVREWIAISCLFEISTCALAISD